MFVVIRERFEQLLVDPLDYLPPDLGGKMENIEVRVVPGPRE
jgi:predicted Zn-dependent protease with MMP-like domain